MSLDTRNTSALFKRAEQLKRWEESEMNRAPVVYKNPNNRRIKFSSGCIFLAACSSGDKDEVSRLLDTGADINTANVDGLTALHQACIDDNLDMVEYLVQQGADVNRKDNEGWTPLHATSSCDFLSIARYLIESGADLAAINSDGELALDLATSDEMEDLIRNYVEEQGIDCEEARKVEEKVMLNDAKKWLRNENSEVEKPHPKTGATALHVAAAKGYLKVLNILLDGRADIDRQDIDGWTPLHAAAYWGQRDAAQLLINAQVDVDITNYSGQTALDIAQKDIVPILEEARKNIKRPKRRPASQIRITDTIENIVETPPKVIRVDIKPIDNKDKEDVPEKENQPTEPEVILRRTQSFENDEKNTTTASLTPTTTTITNSQPSSSPPTSPINTPATTPTGQIRRSFVPPTRDEESETQRKAHAKRVRETRRSTQGVTLDEIKSAEQLVRKSNSNTETSSTPTTTTPATTTVVNDRVPSINAEEKQPQTPEHLIACFTLSAPKPAAAIEASKKDDKITASYTVNASLPSPDSRESEIGSPTPSSPLHQQAERRPSWRLKVDAGCKFKLEDVSAQISEQQHDTNTIASAKPTLPSPAQRKQNGENVARPMSAPVISAQNDISDRIKESSAAPSTHAADVTLPLRSSKSNEENKENDKENENRTAQATQAVIQRRRRPKRRSTGVVHLDLDELDPDRKDDSADPEDKDKESGTDKSRSRVGSEQPQHEKQESRISSDAKENGGDYIDYKALYEAAKADNDKLKTSLRKKDEEIGNLKGAIDRFTNATTKNSLSELEKRERRAMERKISEMEEELKQLDVLRTENQRLKDENGALIRVISKLSR